MPVLALSTNVKVPDAKKFSLDLSKVASEILGKPEAYIAISYQYNEHLTFGGSFDPAFVLVVTSLNNINAEANEKYSAAIFAFLEKELAVPGARGYIDFHDPGRENLGHQGTTCATIFGKK